jgi:hypothetical protein
MGRIAKQKRLIIEQANKRILKEWGVDIDKVLKDMKYKFGYGDLSSGWIDEFEDHMGADLIDQLSTNEYTDLFSDWMRSKTQEPDYEDYDSMERRYDDRINYGIDDESRYDDRNYQYGNKLDDY